MRTLLITTPKTAEGRVDGLGAGQGSGRSGQVDSPTWATAAGRWGPIVETARGLRSIRALGGRRRQKRRVKFTSPDLYDFSAGPFRERLPEGSA